MYVGAFDIGGTKTIVALADEEGKVFGKRQWATDTSDCFRHLDMCCEVFQQFLSENALTPADIVGIGVNLPGLVDREKGILLRAVYAGWYDVPVKDYLIKRLEIPNIVCENDVNSCAMGELRFGLGRRYRSFGWMTVSTGVGGAVVNDGQLIRGANGYAGEFGHLKVEYEQPNTCPCGEMGCLEAHGSGTALNRLIQQRTAQDEAFRAAFEEIGETPNAAACSRLARQGNETARAIFTQVGEYLGKGIAYYANILDPEAMVIGGGVSASLDLMLAGIRKAIDEYTFAQMREIKILPTALGYEAALMGAFAIALPDEEVKV